ncbi:MAG: SDR family oxidoreductase [Bacteroidetes bacterium]|nr:SDR family oxidoreductase [Bacteroidota bacterium]
MEKLIVFGATGGTGQEVVKQALDRGHEVTIIVRNLQSFSMQHPHLKIFQGDVLQPSTFAHYMQGMDAVISCLGVGSRQPTTLYSTGITNIISAMEAAGVQRLICISAGALYVNKQMGFFISMLTKLVLQKILKNMYADMRLMEHIVEESKLNWTIVRPPMLKNKAFTGSYRTAITGHIKHPSSIARADLADFMLNILTNPKTFSTKAEISY